MSGQIQNEDFKTEAELVAAGGAKTQLLNDTKVYVTGNGINETLDDAFSTGKLLIAKQITTPASPAATYNRLYPKSDDKWYTLTSGGAEVEVGSGSGGGGDINYVLNPNALTSTSGWAVYADAAGVVPVDGTGGSPAVTIARNTTTPLRGTTDFLFTKDAANRQGEGNSYDFTINKADQAKPLRFSFDYSVSTNYSYTNNDLVFYIYDVTNAVMIQPTPYVLDGSGRASFEFQSNANSVSYRLIMHIATTNASAWTMNFVNVKVSPTPAPSMLNVRDKQYDLTVTGTGWTTVKAVGVPYKTKDGSWRLRFNIDGNVSSASRTTYTASISGVSFYAGTTQYVTAYESGISGAATTYAIAASNTSNLTLYHGSDTTSGYGFSGDVALNSMPTWAVDFYPVSLSDGAETRVVAASYNNATMYNNHYLNYTGKILDTHNAYNTSTGTFTAPVVGTYQIMSTFLANDNDLKIYLYKNGSNAYTIGSTYTQSANYLASASAMVAVSANVGDQFQIYYEGTSLAGTVGCVSFCRISGPATIAASEFVGAKYSTGAGQTMSAADTIVNFNTKIYDTHNAVTTGAFWKFTAPSFGTYAISSHNLAGSTSWSAGTFLRNTLYKNGSGDSLAIRFIGTTATNYESIALSTTVKLNAGDYIDLRLYTSPTIALNSSDNQNWICISKIN